MGLLEDVIKALECVRVTKGLDHAGCTRTGGGAGTRACMWNHGCREMFHANPV